MTTCHKRDPSMTTCHKRDPSENFSVNSSSSTLWSVRLNFHGDDTSDAEDAKAATFASHIV